MQKSPGEWIQIVTGACLLAAGAWLGFTVFSQADAVLHEPQKLSAWLELRKAVHQAEPKKEESLLTFKPEASLVKDEQIMILGGYFSLLLGIVLLLVMAKIAAGFLTAGSRLMRAGLEPPPRNHDS